MYTFMSSAYSTVHYQNHPVRAKKSLPYQCKVNVDSQGIHCRDLFALTAYNIFALFSQDVFQVIPGVSSFHVAVDDILAPLVHLL